MSLFLWPSPATKDSSHLGSNQKTETHQVVQKKEVCYKEFISEVLETIRANVSTKLTQKTTVKGSNHLQGRGGMIRTWELGGNAQKRYSCAYHHFL